MAGIIQPEYGPDWGKIISQGMDTYFKSRVLNRRDRADELARLAFDNPRALNELAALDPRRAAGIQSLTRTRQINEAQGNALSSPEAMSAYTRLDPVGAKRLLDARRTERENRDRERSFLSLEIKDLQPREQVFALENRIRMLQARGEDTSGEERLVRMITSPDPADNVAAMQALNRAVDIGYQKKYLKPPSLMSEAYTRGTPEYLKAAREKLEKGSGIQIAVNTGRTGEGGTGLGVNSKVFGSEMAKFYVKKYGEAVKEAEDMAKQAQIYQQMKAIDVETGAGQPLTAKVQKLLSAVGVTFGDTLAPKELINALSKELVLKKKSTQAGPQTDKDEATIIETVASLGSSQDAFQFLLNSGIAKAARAEEYAAMMEKVLGNNGTIREVRKKWKAYTRRVPLLSTYIRGQRLKIPIFYYNFKEQILSKKPDIPEAMIQKAWRQTISKRPKK